MEKTDEQLLADHLNGDDSAFPLLVSRNLPSMYSFAYRMIKDKEVAEDTTQEIFVKIWKKSSSYKSGKNFKAWMYAIARNACLDWLRKRKHLSFSQFENDEGDNMLTETLQDESELLPDEQAIQKEDKVMLEHALEKIPHHYREVLVLRYGEDLTFEEIGTILKKPLNTVKSQYRRALSLLRTLLAEKMHQK